MKEVPDLPIAEEEVDLSLPPFHLGTDYESYKYFGAHPTEENGVQGTRFRVWAPHAKNVSVINEVTGYAFSRLGTTRQKCFCNQRSHRVGSFLPYGAYGRG